MFGNPPAHSVSQLLQIREMHKKLRERETEMKMDLIQRERTENDLNCLSHDLVSLSSSEVVW